MGRTSSYIAVALALVACLPATLAAQSGPTTGPASRPEPPTGESPWYSVSLGAGTSRFTCDPCATSRAGGPTVRIAAGETLARGLRIGLVAGGWTHADGEGDGRIRESVTHAGVFARVDLPPRRWLHLTGGVGWVGWRSDPFAYDAVDVTVGGGWELPLRGRWALSNDVLLHSASFGSMRNDGETAVRDVSLSLLGFEVGLVRR